MAPLKKDGEAAPFPRRPRQDLQPQQPRRQQKPRAPRQKKSDPKRPQSPSKQSTKCSLRQERELKGGKGGEWKEGTSGGGKRIKKVEAVMKESMKENKNIDGVTRRSKRLSMKDFERSDGETLEGSVKSYRLKKDERFSKSFESDPENAPVVSSSMGEIYEPEMQDNLGTVAGGLC